MVVNVYFEKTDNGFCSCFVEEDLEGFGLTGFGSSYEEAKKDMLQSYKEIKELFAEEGKEIQQLEFNWHEDKTYLCCVMEKGENNYSAYLEDYGVVATGATIEKTKSNMVEAIKIYIEECGDLDFTFDDVYIGWNYEF